MLSGIGGMFRRKGRKKYAYNNERDLTFFLCHQHIVSVRRDVVILCGFLPLTTEFLRSFLSEEDVCFARLVVFAFSILSPNKRDVCN
jgi:hypothetical protein